MPYTVDSLPANIKKLPVKKRRQWMHVFNSAYARATGDTAAKEAAAFAQANGVVLKKKADEGDDLPAPSIHVDEVQQVIAAQNREAPTVQQAQRAAIPSWVPQEIIIRNGGIRMPRAQVMPAPIVNVASEEVVASDAEGYPSAYVPYMVQEHGVDKEEANYNPIGATQEKGCHNCRWFVTPDACIVVKGVIAPTGVSMLWREEDSDEQTPLPVEITNVEQVAAAFAEGDDPNAGAIPVDSLDVPAIDMANALAMAGVPQESAPAVPAPTIGATAGASDTEQEIARLSDMPPVFPRDEFAAVSLASIPDSPILMATPTTTKPKPTTLYEQIKGLIKFKASGDEPSLADSAKTFCVYKVKGDDDVEHLRFFTTWTNACRDDGQDLIPTYAHKEMVEWADSNPEDHMPELIFWHVVGTEFGKVDWLEFDGLLVHASGPIYDDPWSQGLAVRLAQMPDPGMSHGSIYRVKEDDGTITGYYPFEISAIPERKYARNKYTSWSLGVWEDTMAFSEAKKVALKELGKLNDNQIAALEGRTEAFKEAVKAHGVEWKAEEDGSDPIPDLASLTDAVTAMAQSVTTLASTVEGLAVDTKEAKATATAALVAANKSTDEIVAGAFTPPAAQVLAAQQQSRFVATQAEDTVVTKPAGAATPSGNNNNGNGNNGNTGRQSRAFLGKVYGDMVQLPDEN